MHRHLFHVYSETSEHILAIQQATRVFNSLIQGSSIPIPTNDPVFGDVVTEYLIDTKLYLRTDYNPNKAKDMLLYSKTISDAMKTYLYSEVCTSIVHQQNENEQEYQRLKLDYQDQYNQDKEFPIYCKILQAKETYEQKNSILFKAKDILEWIKTEVCN